MVKKHKLGAVTCINGWGKIWRRNCVKGAYFHLIVLLGKCWGGTGHDRFLPHLFQLIILHPFIRHYIVWVTEKTSLNKLQNGKKLKGARCHLTRRNGVKSQMCCCVTGGHIMWKSKWGRITTHCITEICEWEGGNLIQMLKIWFVNAWYKLN
jgi:hypothetical protein